MIYYSMYVQTMCSDIYCAKVLENMVDESVLYKCNFDVWSNIFPNELKEIVEYMWCVCVGGVKCQREKVGRNVINKELKGLRGIYWHQ